MILTHQFCLRVGNGVGMPGEWKEGETEEEAGEQARWTESTLPLKTCLVFWQRMKAGLSLSFLESATQNGIWKLPT